MKLLILTNAYPSENDLYANQFVYSRVVSYQKHNIEVTVFIPGTEESDSYTYDGTIVYKGNKNQLYKLLGENEFSKIHIHFLDFNIRELVSACCDVIKEMQIDIFFHGYEVTPPLEYLGRRIKLIDFINPKELKMSIWKYRDIQRTKKFLDAHKKLLDNLVFVSEHFMNRVKTYLKLDNSKYKMSVVPNIIDSATFSYKRREQYNKILFIRPFRKHDIKYAVDIAIKGLESFVNREKKECYSLSIFGQGEEFEKYTNLLPKTPNIHIERKFFDQDGLKKVMDEHDILIVPTREDAQGVLMCQAMSAGMIVIASNVEAIPEFLPDDCGFKINNKHPEEISEYLSQIISNPEKSKLIAERGSAFIQDKCSFAETIKKEIMMIGYE